MADNIQLQVFEKDSETAINRARAENAAGIVLPIIDIADEIVEVASIKDEIVEVPGLVEQAQESEQNAEAYANSLVSPTNTVIVDSKFSDTLGVAWQFNTIQAMLAYVRAQQAITPATWRVVVGFGYVLPDGEDIYDLYDEGIICEFTFDVWENWLRFGGLLDLANLQYDIEVERLPYDIELTL